jgi:hypothetical protein
MANEIRVNTSVQIIQDVGDSAGDQAGITYSNQQLDGNADARTWGGKYTMNAVYTDADVAYWSNVVVAKDDASGADGIDDSDWTEASAVTNGALPDTAYVVAVEYVSALGSPGVVTINVSGENFAVLDEGQAVVIPMEMGAALSSITIKCTDYTDGTNEATVNVMVAGV